MKTALLVLLAVTLSFEASAFKLYKTSTGRNIRWSVAEVEIVLDESLSALAPKEDVEAVISAAFTMWGVDAGLPLSFLLVWDQCDEVADDGNNCIFACEDKGRCYNRPKEKGGTTYLNVAPSKGHITDVDIVLNAEDWEWDLDGSNHDGLNFARVISHEIGHLLGIDHSEEPEAIMYATLSVSNKTAPELHSDDVQAAETLYEGFVPVDVPQTSACAVAHTGAASGRAGLVLLLMSLFALILTRR